MLSLKRPEDVLDSKSCILISDITTDTQGQDEIKI
jgi:hypothetical protein